MGWTLTGDVAGYLANAGELLRSRAAENTIIVSAVEALQVRGINAFGGTAPLFGWWAQAGGAVTAAFMHTPPYPVALTVMPPGVASALAETLATRGRAVAGVNGDGRAAAAFAAAWQARTAQPSRVSVRMRMYRLAELRHPDPAPRGRARLATAADTGLLLAWLAAFSEEATPGSPETVRTEFVADRLSFGGLTLWQQGGTPVSLAGQLRPAAGQVRVGPVYTPPGWRGRGFGAAVTATVCQAALDAGAREVLLFTDLANPTSNALYQRLGFRPVTDRVGIVFQPRA
jgi:predicted GNAT family acetyltransferase